MKSKNTLKKFGVISCTAIIAVILAGCSMEPTQATTAVENEQPIVKQEETTTSSESTIATESLAEDYIGETQAKNIALTHAGVNETDVAHMFCKLDYDDGVAEYEVEFWDGNAEYDYEINALSGEIIGYDYDIESYDANTATTPSNTNETAQYIGEEQAKAIAFAHAGVSESEAGHVECELDIDDGYAEYEVEWQIGITEYDYTISATDGTIREHDVEQDD